MSITRFAIEADAMCGRAFNHSDYELDSGERYQGLYLLRTADEAASEIATDAQDRDDDDDDEEFVTTVHITPEGAITDQDGLDVLPDLAMSLGLSVQDLMASASAYYAQEVAPAIEPSAPGM